MADQPSPHAQKFFEIQSTEDKTKFTANFADGAPIVTEGYAGWQVISRPREIGVVEWQGRNPMAIEIPFMIDFWMASVESNPGMDCEEEVKHLERLCGIGGHKQPPICTVNGGGMIPHDEVIWPAGRWVVEQVTWDRGVELRSSSSGRRLRCGGSLVIRQFITARDILRVIKSSDRAVKPRTYTVKKGDTLSSIAKKKSVYGDASKWKWIADANGLRDRRSLYVGQVLKIPVK